MGIAETYHGRFVGMYDIAREHVRPSSEDPRPKQLHSDMPTAKTEPKTLSPMATIFEDE